MLRGIEGSEAVAQGRITVRVILAVDRRGGKREALDTVELAVSLAHPLIVGIDLSGLQLMPRMRR